MTLFKIVTTKDPPNPPISLLSITKLEPPPEPSPVISARSKMENYLCTRCGKLKNVTEFGSKNNGTRYLHVIRAASDKHDLAFEVFVFFSAFAFCSLFSPGCDALHRCTRAEFNAAKFRARSLSLSWTVWSSSHCCCDLLMVGSLEAAARWICWLRATFSLFALNSLLQTGHVVGLEVREAMVNWMILCRLGTEFCEGLVLLLKELIHGK